MHPSFDSLKPVVGIAKEADLAVSHVETNAPENVSRVKAGI